MPMNKKSSRKMPPKGMRKAMEKEMYGRKKSSTKRKKGKK